MKCFGNYFCGGKGGCVIILKGGRGEPEALKNREKNGLKNLGFRAKRDRNCEFISLS